MFAYSSIEHMGIIAFAFGMGGALANFAGLLHMTMHSLAKSGIFFTVGNITRIKGTQKIAEIRGLTESHPALGWLLVLGVVAIAGLPPLGIFTSEFLVVSSTFSRERLLVLKAERTGLRRAHGQHGARARVLSADLRAFRAGADRRHLSAAGDRRLVSARRQSPGVI